MSVYFKRTALVILFLIITACSNASTEEVKEKPTVSTVKEADVQGVSPTSDVTVETKKEVFSKEDSVEQEKLELEKEIKHDEEIALAYFNEFYNITDVKAKKAFVLEHVIENQQALFSYAASNIVNEEDRFVNPKVKESRQYEMQGKRVTLILIEYKIKTSTREVIVMLADSKLVTGYLPDEKSDKTKSPHFDFMFYVLREEFKDAKLQVVPAKSKLKKKESFRDEKIAVNFFKQFLKHLDTDEGVDYLLNHIDEKMQNFYITKYETILNSYESYTDLKVVESIACQFSDKTKGSLILLKSQDGEEIIVVMRGSKFIWPYKQSERLEGSIIFHKLREKFKTPK